MGSLPIQVIIDRLIVVRSRHEGYTGTAAVDCMQAILSLRFACCTLPSSLGPCFWPTHTVYSAVQRPSDAASQVTRNMDRTTRPLESTRNLLGGLRGTNAAQSRRQAHKQPQKRPPRRTKIFPP